MPNIMLSNELFSPMLSDARGLKRLLVELLPREEWGGVPEPRVVQKAKTRFRSSQRDEARSFKIQLS